MNRLPALPLLTPTAATWLAMPVRAGTRVVVVGVAGGVGTTTVATLLGWALGTYRDGAARAVSGGEDGPHAGRDGIGSTRAPDLTVHDLGPNTATIGPGVDLGAGVGGGTDVLVVVCGAHVHGLLAARDALGGLSAVVVPVAVAGRAEPGARLVAHAAGFGWDAVVIPIARSRALAPGGPLPAPRLAPGPFRAGIAVAVEVVRRAQRPPMPLNHAR